jgi:hypothetical protein
MNTVEAISVLIQSAQMGQSAGIFSLDEARIIADAIDLLTEGLNTTEHIETTENVAS